MLKNHELFAEIVTTTGLAHAQYLLGDHGNAYQGLFSGITRDVFCRIACRAQSVDAATTSACSSCCARATNNMYREPVKPVSAHIGTSIGMTAPCTWRRRTP